MSLALLLAQMGQPAAAAPLSFSPGAFAPAPGFVAAPQGVGLADIIRDREGFAATLDHNGNYDLERMTAAYNQNVRPGGAGAIGAGVPGAMATAGNVAAAIPEPIRNMGLIAGASAAGDAVMNNGSVLGNLLNGQPALPSNLTSTPVGTAEDFAQMEADRLQRERIAKNEARRDALTDEWKGLANPYTQDNAAYQATLREIVDNYNQQYTNAQRTNRIQMLERGMLGSGQDVGLQGSINEALGADIASAKNQFVMDWFNRGQDFDATRRSALADLTASDPSVADYYNYSAAIENRRRDDRDFAAKVEERDYGRDRVRSGKLAQILGEAAGLGGTFLGGSPFGVMSQPNQQAVPQPATAQGMPRAAAGGATSGSPPAYSPVVGRPVGTTPGPVGGRGPGTPAPSSRPTTQWPKYGRPRW